MVAAGGGRRPPAAPRPSSAGRRPPPVLLVVVVSPVPSPSAVVVPSPAAAAATLPLVPTGRAAVRRVVADPENWIRVRILAQSPGKQFRITGRMIMQDKYFFSAKTKRA